jgi:hypothetical protein
MGPLAGRTPEQVAEIMGVLATHGTKPACELAAAHQLREPGDGRRFGSSSTTAFVSALSHIGGGGSSAIVADGVLPMGVMAAVESPAHKFNKFQGNLYDFYLTRDSAKYYKMTNMKCGGVIMDWFAMYNKVQEVTVQNSRGGNC